MAGEQPIGTSKIFSPGQQSALMSVQHSQLRPTPSSAVFMLPKDSPGDMNQFEQPDLSASPDQPRDEPHVPAQSNTVTSYLQQT